MHRTSVSLISKPHFNFSKACDSSNTWKCHKPGNKDFLKVKFDSVNLKSSRSKYIMQTEVENGLNVCPMYADFSTNDREITVGILSVK